MPLDDLPAGTQRRRLQFNDVFPSVASPVLTAPLPFFLGSPPSGMFWLVEQFAAGMTVGQNFQGHSGWSAVLGTGDKQSGQTWPIAALNAPASAINTNASSVYNDMHSVLSPSALVGSDQTLVVAFLLASTNAAIYTITLGISVQLLEVPQPSQSLPVTAGTGYPIN